MPMEVRVLVSQELYSFWNGLRLVAGDLVLATAVVGFEPGEWADAELERGSAPVAQCKISPRERRMHRTYPDHLARKYDARQSDAISRLVRWMTGRDWNAVSCEGVAVLKRRSRKPCWAWRYPAKMEAAAPL